ncbi:3-hydroxyacyl-CoA dehydrogenase NAD-binding domain-containing protein [Endozoicomonadaceae bacterium StTr2]
MTSTVTLEKNNNIAVIAINNPPVNALSQSVRQGIVEALTAAENDADIAAIVLACEGRTFIAGADISEFGKPPLEPHLPDVLQRLQQSSKPVIAALHGTVLGGGFETALSCHFRVALKGTKVGLPEVNLGLIPGSGGTQLLPRVVGVETALQMITSCKSESVDKLVDTDAIDQIVDDNLLQAAIDFAKTVVSEQRTAVAVPERSVAADSFEADIFDQYRKTTARRARGQQAPQLAIDSVENAVKLPFDEALTKEREMFLSCRASSQSRAMRHAFFAERQVAKLEGIDKSVQPLDINEVAIIGAGTMGQGIAMCFASAGLQVRLLELSEDNLQTGLASIYTRYQQNVKRGRMSEQQLTDCMDRIQGTCEYDDLAGVDLVVEAAFENLQVKQQIFSTLDKVCKPEALLATNTSYLDIDQIATATSRPEKVLGMHFFSPANIMKLLEVVRADKTSDETLVTAMQLGRKIRKISVAVGVCYGFVGNRMYACYGREANMLLLEGASPEQIDKAMQAWGMAMGPLAVNDMSGIDIAYKARRENPDLPDDPCYFRAADLMVESGRLGQKTFAGFYLYDEEGKKHADASVLEVFAAEAKRLGVEQREISEQEIQDRLVFALINEGARILDEGIAARAGDIDAIWLNGYGFPRFRGGPMCYAQELGLKNVVSRIEQFREQLGDRYWQPAERLVTLAETGGTLV